MTQQGQHPQQPQRQQRYKQHQQHHPQQSTQRWQRCVTGALVVLVCWCTAAAVAQTPPRALGDVAADKDWYSEHLVIFQPPDTLSLPEELDWRAIWQQWGVPDLGPHEQGSCGSSWAFAAAATMAAKAVIWTGTAYDFSAQQLISGASSLATGCCGGSMEALAYYLETPPWLTTCTGYGDATTSCPPTQSVVPIGSLSGCSSPLGELAFQLYTVETGKINQVKLSLYFDGPTYLRFDVTDDFFQFWSGPADAVYVQERVPAITYDSGLAVLLLGWNDRRNAWLCRASWGTDQRPDGLFWLAYDGHVVDLHLQVASFRPPCDNLGSKEFQTVSWLDMDHPAGCPSPKYGGAWIAQPDNCPVEPGTVLSRAAHGGSLAGEYKACVLAAWEAGKPPAEPFVIEVVTDLGGDCLPGQACGDLLKQRKLVRYELPPDDLAMTAVGFPDNPCYATVWTKLIYRGDTALHKSTTIIPADHSCDEIKVPVPVKAVPD